MHHAHGHWSRQLLKKRNMKICDKGIFHFEDPLEEDEVQLDLIEEFTLQFHQELMEVKEDSMSFPTHQISHQSEFG